MLKQIYIPFILLLSLSIFAQKKELKLVDKLIQSEDYASALEQLLAAQSLVEGSELKYQAQYQFLAGKIYSKQKQFGAAFEALALAKQLEAENGSSKHTAEINMLVNNVTNEAISQAVLENQNENYTIAADLLVMVYNVDQEQKDYLYYAASSAVNGGDFDRALTYYQELKDMNYSGSVQKFYATKSDTGEEIELSADTYVLFQKQKDYTNFRTEMTESKLPEIVKNIALIYVQQKRNDLAIGAIKEAREANPLDVGLILTEANLYIQLGDKEKFSDLMKEAIDKDPYNHILYFNLGVITADQGDRSKARSYYESAIELNPTYAASYLNLAALILDEEPEIVEKMNALGNSRADNLKYDQLKKERESLFLEAAPVLEKLNEIDPTNIEALTTLKNIFGTIGDAAKFKMMKAKLDEIGQ
ncbi:MAG: tetratricopeptide repeat protein [Flavobacteriales bacterium]|nr:tetratricopeptide repeat protein [Flavobacteriales bacterium]